MKKEQQPVDSLPSEPESSDEVILLGDKWDYQTDDGVPDENLWLRRFGEVTDPIFFDKFSPSVLVGKVGVWSGIYDGYKLCVESSDFGCVLDGYEDIIIRQKGERVYFTFIHHDGQHDMEIRRFTEEGLNRLDGVCFDSFSEETLKFIYRHTTDFGKIA